ncbi:MAG: hypothetical protein H6577_10055 [Lewinellaceae bacterium]|nr:hypothetical protein [Saprospiraceae bacterium]MCB9338460.1 hypothetical protein [Lewinellaceae bacterium]
MELAITIKLAAIAVVLLLAAYFILNAVLTYISKFSDQIKKMTKNLMIGAGAAYIIGLFAVPDYVLGLSKPIIQIVGKIAPDFLAM